MAPIQFKLERLFFSIGRVTTDSPAWSGGYTLDYNFEMPFEGLYSSNHADVADSYYPQIVAFAKANGGKEAAALNCTAAGGVGGVPGAVHFAVQIAPLLTRPMDLDVDASRSWIFPLY